MELLDDRYTWMYCNPALPSSHPHTHEPDVFSHVNLCNIFNHHCHNHHHQERLHEIGTSPAAAPSERRRNSTTVAGAGDPPARPAERRRSSAPGPRVVPASGAPPGPPLGLYAGDSGATAAHGLGSDASRPTAGDGGEGEREEGEVASAESCVIA